MVPPPNFGLPIADFGFRYRPEGFLKSKITNQKSKPT